MKKTSFAAAAIIAGAVAFAALCGPASAQAHKQQFRTVPNNGRVHTPPMNFNARPVVGASRFVPNGGASGFVPNTYSNFVTPFSSNSSFASPFSGYSSNFTPFGSSYSGYSAQSYPRILTPYGPVPTMYSTYSSSTSYGAGLGFGYPGFIPPTSYSSFNSPYGGSTSYGTPYGTLYSGYAAQSFPRILTPLGNVPVNYTTFGGYSSPFGSSAGFGFVSPYGTAP